jgi:hypothetical protein
VTEATNEILEGNPNLLAEVQNKYHSFLSSPTTIKILGFNPTAQHYPEPTSDPLCKEILDMKESIATLSKAVHSLMPKATAKTTPPPKPTNPQSSNPTTKGMVKGKKNPPTYAAQTALPPRPSLVLDLGKVQISSRPPSANICNTINNGLANSLTHSQVHMSAARWTARGNLVITAGADTSQYQLNSALMHVASYAKKSLNIPGTAPTPIRANSRWSCILLNRVPTGTTPNTEAHNPDQCHAALQDENPSYAALTITQQPSWVRDPTSYSDGSVSSLSFAFEDPDGSLAANLLSEKELYLFGATAAIKKWKQKPPQKKPDQTPSSANTPNMPTQSHPEQQATPKPTHKSGPTPNTRSNSAKVPASRKG